MKNLANTFVHPNSSGGTSVTFYTTEIIRIADGVVTLNHGGHITATTVSRINYYLTEAGIGGRVSRKDGDMVYTSKAGTRSIFNAEGKHSFKL